MLSDRLVAAIKQLEIRSASFGRRIPPRDLSPAGNLHAVHAALLVHRGSDQAQTRDLFRMQRMHLGNEDLYKELRNEIFDMVQYLDSDVLRRQSGTIHRLTAVTIVGLIGTIATGFLGMNLIAEAEARCASSSYTSASCRWRVILLTVAVVVFSRPLTALLDRMSGERH